MRTHCRRKGGRFVAIKHVGVREMRSEFSRHVTGEDVIAIEKHGHLLGFYIPVRRASEEERRELLHQADEAFARLREESGMSEDEIAAMLNLSKPDQRA
jgi:ribosome-binding protein aMBF1 (putative translation factor)